MFHLFIRFPETPELRRFLFLENSGLRCFPILVIHLCISHFTCDSAAYTEGEGQYTQWVHCELIVGSETIRPAHTQWVNGGHFQKVPTHLPSPNPAGK